MLFAEHGDGHACKGKSRGQGAHVQRNHLACDGRPDIGAHDDANRLGQRHQPGIDKTHHHHGGRRGTLNGAGEHQAGQRPHQGIGRQLCQDSLEPFAGRGLQVAPHHGHAMQEKRQAAQQHQYIGDIHPVPPFLLFFSFLLHFILSHMTESPQ